MTHQSETVHGSVDVAAQDLIQELRNLNEMQFHKFRQLINAVQPQRGTTDYEPLQKSFAALHRLWLSIEGEKNTGREPKRT